MRTTTPFLGKLRGRGWSIALAVGLLLLSHPARAQTARSPLEMKLELESSVRYLRLATEDLQNRDQALASSWNAYVQLRSAHAKIQNWIARSRFPDPTYEWSVPKLQQARDDILRARDALNNPDAAVDARLTDKAADLMAEAAQIIEMVLLTSF